MSGNKIKSREEIAKLTKDLRDSGKIVGYTSGAFDLLHAGHADYLAEAKKNCDYLIVGLNSDKSVKEYKDPNRPIIPEKYRAKVMASLSCVDYIFIFDDKNNNNNIEIIKPSLYIKAGDYDLSQLSSKPIVEKHGGKVVLIPLKESISTTDIIKKIKSLESTDKSIDKRGIGQNNDSDDIKSNAEYIDLDQSEDKLKVIFLDRDGTINEDVSYLHEPEKWEFTPNALDGLKHMYEMGYKLIIVTDQPGIALGYFSKEDFFKLNGYMFKQLAPEGISIDKIYFCPHGHGDDCNCKKPKLGLFEEAQKFYKGKIDVRRSYMIGDKTSDIKAGKDFGLRTILVNTGSAGSDNRCDVHPDIIADDLLDAASRIEELD